ncbi:MAG TPA: hypothetical protein VJK28_01410, partial [Nitrospiria bacterium]|nr:hypothetical protein [Nitrospiria bacterium]
MKSMYLRKGASVVSTFFLASLFVSLVALPTAMAEEAQEATAPNPNIQYKWDMGPVGYGIGITEQVVKVQPTGQTGS